MGETDGLRILSHAVNNMAAQLLSYQKGSDRWRSELSDKIDANHATTLTKLKEVCDKGGKEHDGFDSRLNVVEDWIKAQQFRTMGRADILGPALALIKANWGKLLIALWLGWTQIAEPWLERSFNPSAVVDIRGRL